MDDAVGQRRIDHACFNRCQRCISEQMIIMRVYRTEVLMPRFTIGERVEVSGVLAEIYGGIVGTVLAVIPDLDGVSGLDIYTIVFEGSRQAKVRQAKLCDFQLTHGGHDRQSANRKP